jgi:hypothetical protein
MTRGLRLYLLQLLLWSAATRTGSIPVDEGSDAAAA